MFGIPTPTGMLVRVVAIGLIAAAAFAWHLHAVGVARQDGRDEIQVKWDQDRTKMIAAHDAALADRLAESGRRIADQTKVADDERAKREALEAENATLRTMLNDSNARAGAAQRRLRDAVATNDLATRARFSDPALAVQCAPAVEAADLRGRLLQGFDDLAARIEQRIGDAAGTVGVHADDAFGRLSECARRYDALIKPTVAGASP